jgi:hypothetical protein
MPDRSLSEPRALDAVRLQFLARTTATTNRADGLMLGEVTALEPELAQR